MPRRHAPLLTCLRHGASVSMLPRYFMFAGDATLMPPTARHMLALFLLIYYCC